MSLTAELASKDALIRKQAELLKKQRELLVQYLILDIEDYLTDMRAKAEEGEESFDPRLHRTKLPKYRHLHLGVVAWRAIRYQSVHMWEQWATNPYGLRPLWYLMIMLLLLGWMHFSIIIGRYEIGSVTGSVRLARFGRACLGAIPPIVQFLLFLFPPLFVQF